MAKGRRILPAAISGRNKKIKNMDELRNEKRSFARAPFALDIINPSKPQQPAQEINPVTPAENVSTVSVDQKAAFPFTIIILALICTLLFAYIIYNYVLIYERTSVVADLRAEISTLSSDVNDLNAKLEMKNDLSVILELALYDYGMVSIDEIEKRYVSIDFKDVIIKPQVLE
ncbi:MAG: hypothetical protein IKX86_04965 [Clostridia bacterium]|nr:hypothetical protein [Clostridia bacterium]